MKLKKFDTPETARAFVLANTRVNEAPLVPELPLYLADEVVPLWHLTEAELEESGLPPPFWAFAWAGGQALARYVLDQPEVVAGRRVLTFACGAGLEALASARSGAAHVIANDIDPLACVAAQVNAELNKLAIETSGQNLVGRTDFDAEVILAGDVCYEQPLSGEIEAWLRTLAAEGRTVLLGDPGRTYLPKSGVEKLVSYAVKTTRELEDTDVRNASVWRLIPRG